MAISRRDFLNTQINEAYDLLGSFERQLLTSDDPREKFKLNQDISELRKQISGWQDELAILPPNVPADSKSTSPARKLIQPSFRNYSSATPPAYSESGNVNSTPLYKSRTGLILIGTAVALLALVAVLIVLLVVNGNNDNFVVEVKDTANVLSEADKNFLTSKATNLSYSVKYFTTRNAPNTTQLIILVKDELKSLKSPGIVLGLNPQLRLTHVEVNKLGLNEALRIQIEEAGIPFLQRGDEKGAFGAMIDEARTSVVVPK